MRAKAVRQKGVAQESAEGRRSNAQCAEYQRARSIIRSEVGEMILAESIPWRFRGLMYGQERNEIY